MESFWSLRLKSHIVLFMSGKQRSSLNISLSHKLKSPQLQSIIETSTFVSSTTMEKPPSMKSKRIKGTKKWKLKIIPILKTLLQSSIHITSRNRSETYAHTKSPKPTHQSLREIIQSWPVSTMQSDSWTKLYICPDKQFCKNFSWVYRLPCLRFSTNSAIKFLILRKYIKFSGLNMTTAA